VEKVCCIISGMSLVKQDESFEDFHSRLMDPKEVHRYEIYSLNYTFACFMLPRVKLLKKQFQNHPRWCLEKFEECPTEENKASYERYRDFVQGLNDIIFMFNFYAKGRESQTWSGHPHHKQFRKRIKRGWNALRDNYDQMWF